MARDDGVTRLLAGDGGDELFGGNSRYAKQRVFGWYDQVPGAAQRPAGAAAAAHAAGGLPLRARARSYIEQAKRAAARPHADVQPAAAPGPTRS
jgi:asparagine synthase (glutamine-hydrolysing)